MHGRGGAWRGPVGGPDGGGYRDSGGGRGGGGVVGLVPLGSAGSDGGGRGATSGGDPGSGGGTMDTGLACSCENSFLL